MVPTYLRIPPLYKYTAVQFTRENKYSKMVVVAFFLACEDFGRMFDNLSPAYAFFKVEISSRT